MTRAYRCKMTPVVVLLGVLIFFSSISNIYALENQSHENAYNKSKKETLVARDIGFGFSKIRWCGNDRLLLYGYEKGIKLLDLATGKWTIVSTDGTRDYPLNCSPDGKWVIYVDWKSIRTDMGRVAVDDDEKEGEVEWQGDVKDLYRYDVSTGKAEKFATRRDRPESADVVSPDGTKAFLGGMHDTPFEMPEPKWEMRWLKSEWAHLDPIWLADSSGIVTEVFDDRSNVSLGVEIFGDNGWSKEFIPGRDLYIKGRLGDAIATKNKTIYLRSGESYSERQMGRVRYYFYTCDIKQSGLNCKEILEFDLRHTDIRFAVLPDGDMVYKESDDKCIRRFSQSRAKTECILDGSDMGGFYGVSPDGRRIAYWRDLKKPDKSLGYGLYVMDIN